MKFLIGIWTIIAALLNILGITAISWIVVFAPLAIYFGAIIMLFLFALLIALFASKVD